MLAFNISHDIPSTETSFFGVSNFWDAYGNVNKIVIQNQTKTFFFALLASFSLLFIATYIPSIYLLPNYLCNENTLKKFQLQVLFSFKGFCGEENRSAGS